MKTRTRSREQFFRWWRVLNAIQIEVTGQPPMAIMPSYVRTEILTDDRIAEAARLGRHLRQQGFALYSPAWFMAALVKDGRLVTLELRRFHRRITIEMSGPANPLWLFLNRSGWPNDQRTSPP